MQKHRHITRYTRPLHRQDAFFVRVSRRGRKFHQYFHIARYPSEQAALEAALEYRDRAYALLGLRTAAHASLAAAATAAAALPPADRATLAKHLIDTISPLP